MPSFERCANFHTMRMVKDFARLVGCVVDGEAAVVEDTLMESGIGVNWKMAAGANSQFLF